MKKKPVTCRRIRCCFTDVCFVVSGYKLWKYADSIGAVLIGIYIIVSWFFMGWREFHSFMLEKSIFIMIML